MKKHSFIIGMLCGGILFGGAGVIAAEVTAVLSDNPFYINGEKIEMTAYNIADNNYVRLRDIGKALDISVTYDPETNSVLINSDERYTVDIQTQEDETRMADGRRIDGQDAARKDFSQKANPAVFDGVYTRAAYNAVRQTIADQEIILAGNAGDGYNPAYTYAHLVDPAFTLNSPGQTEAAVKSALTAINGCYVYELGYEPDIANIYEYPGYRICKIRTHTFFEPANQATKNFVAAIQNLSVREKVKKIADIISDRIVYGTDSEGGVNEIFTSEEPVQGSCAAYASAVNYLCQRAGIPCVVVKDNENAWKEVYADGRWGIVDVCNYDVGKSDTFLFAENYPRQDKNPDQTRFSKEILVPGSTQ